MSFEKKTVAQYIGINLISPSTAASLTNFMELILSWEAASGAATQEFYSILWNRKVHYGVHKSPPLVPLLIQIDPAHTTHPICLSSILISIHLRLVLPGSLLPSGFSTIILYKCIFPFVLYAPPISSSLTSSLQLPYKTYFSQRFVCNELQGKSLSLCPVISFVTRDLNLQQVNNPVSDIREAANNAFCFTTPCIKGWYFVCWRYLYLLVSSYE
jgi:hypothetical protein